MNVKKQKGKSIHLFNKVYFQLIYKNAPVFTFFTNPAKTVPHRKQIHVHKIKSNILMIKINKNSNLGFLFKLY